MTMPQSKPALRQAAKALRQTLPMAHISEAICHRISSMPAFQVAQHLLAYLPMPGELDLRPLIQAFPEKHWYLPRVGNAQAQLSLHAYHWGDPLETHAYGMQEPFSTALPCPSPGQLDWLLLPGLMFDRQGHRLGYGKGYYDRLLASFPTPFAGLWVGAVPDDLLMETLPTDPWDLPADWVVTEQQTLRIRRSDRAQCRPRQRNTPTGQNRSQRRIGRACGASGRSGRTHHDAGLAYRSRVGGRRF